VSVDERELARKGELRVLQPAPLASFLDGPIWWVGPILLLVATAVVLLVGLPRIVEQPVREERRSENTGSSIASSSVHVSRN